MIRINLKGHCVGVLNEVADFGEEVIATKRGKPLARIVPIAKSSDTAKCHTGRTQHKNCE